MRVGGSDGQTANFQVRELKKRISWTDGGRRGDC